MNKELLLVSVCCLSYNHRPYIKDCLEGFVKQQCNFQFEVLIHDDASTDGTSDIIREYQKKYPNIIKPIIQTENQYQKGVAVNWVYNFPRAKGKYIALCEGDDYWIDPLKLQKQVDYMENNPECSVCFHAAKCYRADSPSNYHIRRPKNIPKDNKFGIVDIIAGGGGFMTTNSMVMKKEYLEIEKPLWMNEAPVGDLPLALFLGVKGEIGYIDEVMSVYRMFSSNHSWTSLMLDRSKEKKHFQQIIEMWKKFDIWTEFKYHSNVKKKIHFNTKNYFKKRLKQTLKIIFKR